MCLWDHQSLHYSVTSPCFIPKATRLRMVQPLRMFSLFFLVHPKPPPLESSLSGPHLSRKPPVAPWPSFPASVSMDPGTTDAEDQKLSPARCSPRLREGLFYLFVALTMYSQGPETEQTLWTGFQGKPGLHRSPPREGGPRCHTLPQALYLGCQHGPRRVKGGPWHGR